MVLGAKRADSEPGVDGTPACWAERGVEAAGAPQEPCGGVGGAQCWGTQGSPHHGSPHSREPVALSSQRGPQGRRSGGLPTGGSAPDGLKTVPRENRGGHRRVSGPERAAPPKGSSLDSSQGLLPGPACALTKCPASARRG